MRKDTRFFSLFHTAWVLKWKCFVWTVMQFKSKLWVDDNLLKHSPPLHFLTLPPISSVHWETILRNFSCTIFHLNITLSIFPECRTERHTYTLTNIEMETSCVWILWESWGITYIPKVKDKSWYLHHCSRHKAIIIVPKAAFFSPNQASWQESALKTMSEMVQKMSKQQTTKLDDRKSWEWDYTQHVRLK